MRLTTTDLYESGFLHCSGAHLIDIWKEQNQSSTVIFVFDGDQLEVLQKCYHNGSATVNLSEYRNSLEHLKDKMFEMLRSKKQLTSSTQRTRKHGYSKKRPYNRSVR